MSLSNDAENLALAWMFTTGTATRPTAWYVALHTSDPGETGANETTTGQDASYVRKAVTFATPSSGQTQNTGAVSWTIGSGTGFTATHASIWTASTAGTCLAVGQLIASRALSSGGALTFEIGEVVVAAD